jgi:hypothetical protein
LVVNNPSTRPLETPPAICSDSRLIQSRAGSTSLISNSSGETGTMAKAKKPN